MVWSLSSTRIHIRTHPHPPYFTLNAAMSEASTLNPLSKSSPSSLPSHSLDTLQLSSSSQESGGGADKGVDRGGGVGAGDRQRSIHRLLPLPLIVVIGWLTITLRLRRRRDGTGGSAGQHTFITISASSSTHPCRGPCSISGQCGVSPWRRVNEGTSPLPYLLSMLSDITTSP